MIDDDDGSNWKSKLAEGGLPQVVAGPAGKALSRLVGAAVDIPVAYLEGISGKLKDKREAERILSNAIAQNAAEIVSEDTALIQRAIYSMVHSGLRAQECREKVAAATIEDLRSNPPNDHATGPSDQFMAKFVRLSEDATSENLQMLFGKLLAGEIRNEGSVPLSTLHLVSMLDEETSKIIQRAMPSITKNGIALTDILEPPLDQKELLLLEQAGFWSSWQKLNLDIDESGSTMIRVNSDGQVIILFGLCESCQSVGAQLLSKAGIGLINAIDYNFEIVKFANHIGNSCKSINKIFKAQVGSDEVARFNESVDLLYEKSSILEKTHKF